MAQLWLVWFCNQWWALDWFLRASYLRPLLKDVCFRSQILQTRSQIRLRVFVKKVFWCFFLRSRLTVQWETPPPDLWKSCVCTFTWTVEKTAHMPHCFATKLQAIRSSIWTLTSYLPSTKQHSVASPFWPSFNWKFQWFSCFCNVLVHQETNNYLVHFFSKLFGWGFFFLNLIQGLTSYIMAHTGLKRMYWKQ